MATSTSDKIMGWLDSKRQAYERVYQDPNLNVDMQQMGKIRIETMDDLLLARKTEVQREVPILYTNTVLDRVDAAIPEEKEATDDYAELENQLREAAAMAEKSGNHDKAVFLSSAADTVSEIRTDEMDHLAKFLQMHKTLDDLGFKLTGD